MTAKEKVPAMFNGEQPVSVIAAHLDPIIADEIARYAQEFSI